MGLIERLTADVACLRGALRTLRMTTPIARNPTRVFPQVIAELADKYGDAPALLSDRERFSYRELAARSNRYARWALAQDIRKGDTICLLMPNRPEFLAIWLGVTRVGGVVALLNTHLTGTALAHCINVVKPEAHHRGGRIARSARDRARAHHRRRQGLAARRCRRRFRAHRSRGRRPSRRRPRGGRAPPAHHRGPRALHLHVRHHRPAEGRQRQSLPGDAGEPRLRRRHGHARQRPHVRLPAALSHRRRRAGDRRAADPGRLGGDPRQIFRARVLGRHRALGLHLLPVYRRALPLPPQLAAEPEGARAPAAARLRQRPAARRLAGIQAALPNSADHRVLRRDRRQRLAVQFRRQGRRGRPAALVDRRAASRPRSSASTWSASSRCATTRASASNAASTSRAR